MSNASADFPDAVGPAINMGAVGGAASMTCHEKSTVIALYQPRHGEKMLRFLVFAIVALKLLRFWDILSTIL
jgi:hypothetical protein